VRRGGEERNGKNWRGESPLLFFPLLSSPEVRGREER